MKVASVCNNLPVGGRADKVDNRAALLDKAEAELAFELKRIQKSHIEFVIKVIRSKF